MCDDKPVRSKFVRSRRFPCPRLGTICCMGLIRKVLQLHREVLSFPPNERRKVQTLLRLYTFQFLKLLRFRTVVRLGAGSCIEWDVRQKSTIRIAYMNPPDHLQWDFWSRLLGPGSIFVDVGANVGIYSILAAEKGSRVIAFEPDPQNLVALRSNLKLNHYSHLVDVRPIALGPTAGFIAINSGLGPLSHVSEAPFDASLNPPNHNQSVVTVSTLDCEISLPVSGMKMDVEGFELAILDGANKALGSCYIPIIQLEWNSLSDERYGIPRSKIQRRLSSFGYTLFDFQPGGALKVSDGSATLDVLAVHARKLEELEEMGIQFLR